MRLRCRVELEGLCDELGVFGAGGVMQVSHRGLDVGVAHPLLHPADVGESDHAGAERVAQIVEPQLTEAGRRERKLVPPSQGRRIEVFAGFAGEHEIIILDPVAAVAQPGQRPGYVRREGNRADLA